MILHNKKHQKSNQGTTVNQKTIQSRRAEKNAVFFRASNFLRINYYRIVKYKICFAFLTGIITTLPLCGEEPWLNLNFDNRKFFTQELSSDGSDPQQGSWKGVGAPHAMTVDSGDKARGQALKITRIGPHRAFKFSGNKAVEADSNYLLETDFFLPAKGGSYFLILDRSGKEISGFSLTANRELGIRDSKGWGKTGIILPGNTWFRLEVSYDAVSGMFIPQVMLDDGSIRPGGPGRAMSKNPPAAIRFGTVLPEGTSALIDNLRLSVIPKASGKPATAPDGRLIWFDQDFENPKFFTPQGLRNGSDERGGVWRLQPAPHGRIVTDSGDNRQTLTITRVGSHRAFNFSGLAPVPEGRNYSFGFDAKLEGNDKTYCILFDVKGNRIAGISLTANRAVQVLINEKGSWGASGLSVPNGWFRIEADINLAGGDVTPRLILPDGTTQTGNAIPLLSPESPGRLQFGTTLPQGAVGTIDNIRLLYDQQTSSAGRVDAAKSAKITDTAKGKNVELAKISKVSTLIVHGTPGTAVTVRGVNAMGQFQTLLDNAVLGKEGALQIDFPPARLSKLDVEGKIKSLQLFESAVFNRRDADREFLTKVYGEFFLPVYSSEKHAELHLFNTTSQAIKTTISLAGRHNGKTAAQLQETTLVPGENIVRFSLAELPAGEFVAEVKAAGPGTGSFRRLLRRQLTPDPKISGVPDLSGKKIFFPDGYFLEESSRISFVPAVPEISKVTISHTDPRLLMQHGDGLYLENGRLTVPFSLIDNFFNLASRRRFKATASPDDLKWVQKELPGDFTALKSSNAMAQNLVSGDWNPKPGADGKVRYRLYDPERDGKVDVRQVQIKYITFMPAGTLGGENLPDWEGVKPGLRTTWAIWHKSPGESLILGREPLLTDGPSSGDFESEKDSNDNFAGQWLSDDGTQLFYARGRILRRYPPYNVPYDNGWNIVRILTIFRTSDGINFDRSYMALPDNADPPGTQHYGATIFRQKRGAGLRIAFLARYFGRDQRICLELAYSWDGFNWKRFPGFPLLADNGPKGSWNAGYIGSSSYSVELDGNTYALLSWNSSAYHICSELIWNRSDMSSITGSMVKNYMEPREIKKWPLFKNFRDYDELAAYIRDTTINVGLMKFRTDGLFHVAPEENSGSFTTVPLRANGRLTINADTGNSGSIKLQLLAPGGKVIDEKTVSGDGVALPVFDRLPKGEFRIRAELKKAKLYTLSFGKK
jgi:hypothetical protein